MYRLYYIESLKMRHFTIHFLTLGVLTMIAGCGGGGGGEPVVTGPRETTVSTPTGVTGIFDDPQTQTILPDRGNQNATPFYQTVANYPGSTSYLKGVTLRQNNSDGSFDLPVLSGLIVHSTGETQVTDGTVLLVDADGFDGSGVIVDGTASIRKLATNGTYDYVILIDQSYTSGGDGYNGTGLLGIRTEAASMPTSSTATFVGEAEATVITGSQGYELRNGTSQLSVNFSTSKLDVTMAGFTATDLYSQTVTTAPINSIVGNNLTIAGNGFSGGTFSTLNNGSTVNLTGANTSTLSGGAFFGYNTNSATPDEVGGVVLMKGDNGLVSAWYIAD